MAYLFTGKVRIKTVKKTMKMYKWTGDGINAGVVIIVIADTLKHAKVLIYAAMITNNMPRELNELDNIKEIEIIPYTFLIIYTGNPSPQ